METVVVHAAARQLMNTSRAEYSLRLTIERMQPVIAVVIHAPADQQPCCLPACMSAWRIFTAIFRSDKTQTDAQLPRSRCGEIIVHAPERTWRLAII